MDAEVVVPAFKKFDKDGSDTITRDELAALNTELGQTLTDE